MCERIQAKSSSRVQSGSAYASWIASGFFAHRKSEVLGFFTPILVLVAMIVGAFTWYLAFVLCPLLGYFVSLKLCQRALTSGGRPAFKRYAISTLLGFVFWPIFWICLVGFIDRLSDGDEVVAGGDALGSALAAVFGLMAFGCAILCWPIAAICCWRSASDNGRPPVPSERVSDVDMPATETNKWIRTMKSKLNLKDARMNRQVLVTAIIAAVAGYVAVWLPWHLAGSPRNMVDGMQLISLLYLVLVGFGCAVAVPHRFWVAGLAPMSLFPVMAIVGAVRDPASHNLLGMEFVMYGFLTFPPLFGGVVGKVIRALLARCRR